MLDFYGKYRANISYMHAIAMQFLMENNSPLFQLFGVAYHSGQPAANLHVEIIVASHLPVSFFLSNVFWCPRGFVDVFCFFVTRDEIEPKRTG